MTFTELQHIVEEYEASGLNYENPAIMMTAEQIEEFGSLMFRIGYYIDDDKYHANKYCNYPIVEHNMLCRKIRIENRRQTQRTSGAP